VDLVAGRAEQHQRIRIAIRQGPGALGGAAIVRAGCVCVSGVTVAGGEEHGRDAIKRPKEAARSLQLAVPARAPSSRDDTAARCWRDLERRDGRTEGKVSSLFLVLLFFINPRFIRRKKRNHKTKPHNSFHPTLVSQRQQQRRETFT
jgi:hypothetical protein